MLRLAIRHHYSQRLRKKAAFRISVSENRISYVFGSSTCLRPGIIRRSRGTVGALPAPVKFLIFIGLNVGGYVGWALGESYGIMTAFLLSSAGSILGVYAGWKL